MTTNTTAIPVEGVPAEAADTPPATAAAEAEQTGRRRTREAVKLRSVIGGRYSGPTDTDEMEKRAKILAIAGRAIPEDVRGNRGDIFACLMWAQALDIPEILAFQHIYFSPKGVPGIRAAFMHALAIRAGHQVETLRADGKKVTLRLIGKDGRKSPQVSWTILEAQRAGLHVPRGEQNPWRLYGTDMLWARCISRLLRRYAPDVIGGLHTPEELEAGVHETGDVLAPDDPDTDPDGNPIVAADVEQFLATVVRADDEGRLLPILTADEVAAKWAEGWNLGVMTQYAGTDAQGIHLTVQEVLADAGERARQDEAAAGTLTGGGIPPAERAHLAEVNQTDEHDAREAAAEAAPAGTPIGCGCNPEFVARTGNHKPGCFDYIEPQEADNDDR